nr:hypothetical protein Iba_chr05dCG11880 [Ipomoea batatas]
MEAILGKSSLKVGVIGDIDREIRPPSRNGENSDQIMLGPLARSNKVCVTQDRIDAHSYTQNCYTARNQQIALLGHVPFRSSQGAGHKCPGKWGKARDLHLLRVSDWVWLFERAREELLNLPQATVK